VSKFYYLSKLKTIIRKCRKDWKTSTIWFSGRCSDAESSC